MANHRKHKKKLETNKIILTEVDKGCALTIMATVSMIQKSWIL